MGGASTNASRTIAQGKVITFQSLFQEGDSQFPYADVGTNLTAYLLISTAASTYQPIMTTTFEEGETNGVSLLSNILTVYFKTNYSGVASGVNSWTAGTGL